MTFERMLEIQHLRNTAAFRRMMADSMAPTAQIAWQLRYSADRCLRRAARLEAEK